MREFRLPLGSSDPISFNCTCDAVSNEKGGLVLLFYRYFAAPPSLSLTPLTDVDIRELAAFHTEITQKLHLGGKIRLGQEGFNITVGGTKDNIELYIKECISHWSFSGLELDTDDRRKHFFKPTSGGCACAFGGSPTSVRVTAEITPMGVTDYVPKVWDNIEVLEPSEFHERCWSEDAKVLVDVRNHYESRIGYFIDPKTGEKAIRPDIRRFSQWPQYVKTHSQELGSGSIGKQIMTYCTGGIRCEKGVRFMAEQIEEGRQDKISTLKGGIAAYLMWMDEEVKQGRKKVEDSLFRGKNYVFDARGAMGLVEDTGIPVASCDMCGIPSDRLSKCRSRGCHLIMVVCFGCEETTIPRCCQSCLDMGLTKQTQEQHHFQPRQMCVCEKEREALLWGNNDNNANKQKGQGWRKKKRAKEVGDINIRFNTVN